MANVTMTLKEYNEMYARLSALEDLVETLFTPRKADYDLQSIEEAELNGGSVRLESTFELPKSMKDTVERLVREKYPNQGEFTNRLETVFIGYLNFDSPQECRACGKTLTRENKLDLYCGKAFCKDCCVHCENYNEGSCYYYKNHIKRLEKEKNQG